MSKLFRHLASNFAATTSSRDKVLTLLAAFATIFVVSWVGNFLVAPYQHPVLVASMGASALLLLVLPNSPLAQPYPFVMGHLAPVAVGVICAHGFRDMAMAAAFTVALSLLVMYLLNCMHPPGAAAALVPALSAPHQALGVEYLWLPVLPNVLTMLVLVWLLNRYLLKREYPVKPAATCDQRHHHKDPSPLAHLGSNAQMKAYTRKFGEIRCRDIMSKDVTTVEYGTDLEEAWVLLRFHKVKILPVVDKARRVIGVISLIDFLKRADLKTYESFAVRLVEFVRKSTTVHSDKPEAVGQIMATPVFTAREDEYIAALVPLLSDRGLHHVPVVDRNQRLVGIVTQSDLIAALYLGTLDSIEAAA